MKQSFFKPLFLFIIVLLMFSCKSITRDDSAKGVSEDTSNMSGVDDFEESVSIFYMFPSPVEILEQFDNSDIVYVPDLISSANNVDKYLTSKARALNLGIYITDLAYASLLGRTSEALKYPEAIQSLSADLGLSNESYKSLIKRVQDNISIKDSLVDISNDIYFAMVEHLETGGQTAAIAQVSSGAYIESLYIGLNSVVTYSENNPVVKQIVEMKYPFENLLAQAENAGEEESDNPLMDYLNQLKMVFDELEPDQAETQITRNADGEIVISGGVKFVMDEANFNEMKARVTKIRTRIIESSN